MRDKLTISKRPRMVDAWTAVYTDHSPQSTQTTDHNRLPANET